jgi:hypothetical protein
MCGTPQGDKPRVWLVQGRVVTRGGRVGSEIGFQCANLEIEWSLGGQFFRQRVDCLPGCSVRLLADSIVVRGGIDARRVARLAAIDVDNVPWPNSTLHASVQVTDSGGYHYASYSDPCVDDLFPDFSIHPAPIFPCRLRARVLHPVVPADPTIYTGILLQKGADDFSDVTPIDTIEGDATDWPIPFQAPRDLSYFDHLVLTKNVGWIGTVPQWLQWSMAT